MPARRGSRPDGFIERMQGFDWGGHTDRRTIWLDGDGLYTDANFYQKGPRPAADVRSFGAVADGVADDTPAFNAALAAVNAVGGGTVRVPQGTYMIASQIVIPGDNVTVEGAGVGRTVLTDAADFSTGMVYATGKNGVSVRNLTLKPTFNGYGLYVDGDVTDVSVQDVFVDQQRTDGSGVVFSAGANGAARVTFRGVRVKSPASSTGTVGIAIGGGTQTSTVSSDLVVEGCTTDGFVTGMHNGQNGVWRNARISDCRFTGAAKWGAYLYHYDQCQVVNCEFSGNDVGAFMDDDSPGQGGLVANCLFRDNLTIGLYREEWAKGAMTGCSFQGNGYGFAMMSGRDVSIAGCTFYGNTRDGVLIDFGASITSLASSGPAQGATYSITNTVHIQDVSFVGCTIAGNSRNGISIKGVQRGFTLTGCVIAQNGQADNPTPTNYADVNCDDNTGGSHNYYVSLVGCVIGNTGGSGTDTGYTKWGIKSASGTLTGMDVVGCRFETLNTPLSVATGTLTVTACTFVACSNNITLPSGYAWRANTINGGTLANQTEATAGNLTVAGDLIQSGGNGARIDTLSGAFQGLRLGNASDVTTSNYNVAGDANGALLLNALTGQTISLRIANGADALTIAAALITAAQLLTTKASASGGAGFRLPHGAAPSSPVDGDMWTTSSGLFFRQNGVTKTVTTT